MCPGPLNNSWPFLTCNSTLLLQQRMWFHIFITNPYNTRNINSHISPGRPRHWQLVPWPGFPQCPQSFAGPSRARDHIPERVGQCGLRPLQHQAWPETSRLLWREAGGESQAAGAARPAHGRADGQGGQDPQLPLPLWPSSIAGRISVVTNYWWHHDHCIVYITLCNKNTSAFKYRCAVRRQIKFVVKRLFCLSSHASLEWLSLEKKFLRWDFNFFCIYFMSTYQNNWAWNQNQVDFKDNVKISAQEPLK